MESKEITQQYHIAKSYLDMARAVIDTRIHRQKSNSKNDVINDVIGGFMSCTYVYSYAAIVAFISGQLHRRWKLEDSRLRKNYSTYGNFNDLMRCEFGEIKDGLKELCRELGIQPHHEGTPQLWSVLNDFLKKYRDWFIHPTPEGFNESFDRIGNKEWMFASNTAVEVIGYYFDEVNCPRPDWLKKGSIVIPKIEVR